MLLTENMIDVFIINGKDRDAVHDEILAFQQKVGTYSPKASMAGEEVELKGLPTRQVTFGDDVSCLSIHH